MTAPLAFAIAVALLLFAPGPTNAVMATAGAEGGRRPVAPLLLAELVAYLLSIAVSRLILLPLIDLYPPVGIAVKIAIAVYLIFAGWRLWRSQAAAVPGSLAGWRHVFATTALNPKGLLLAIGIFPQNDPLLAAYFAGFAVLVLLSGVTWFCIGRTLARLAGSRAALLPRLGASVLFGFAVYIAGTA